jgi:plastocyanin
VPQVSFNYEVPRPIYVPVADPPPLPAVEPVQVTMVALRGDTPPADVRVKQGAVVTWSNPDDTDRTLVIDLAGLNGTSPGVGPPRVVGQSVAIPRHSNYSLVFHQPGTYYYSLQDRPSQRGSIIVEQ